MAAAEKSLTLLCVLIIDYEGVQFNSSWESKSLWLLLFETPIYAKFILLADNDEFLLEFLERGF